MAALILAAASLSAQQQDSACDTKADTKSLGEIASKKPSSSTAAKIRIDDDSLDSVISKVKQPIPDITLDGLDNSDEIVTAINDYKAHHTPEETEAMLKDWWVGTKPHLSGLPMRTRRCRIGYRISATTTASRPTLTTTVKCSNNTWISKNRRN